MWRQGLREWARIGSLDFFSGISFLGLRLSCGLDTLSEAAALVPRVDGGERPLEAWVVSDPAALHGVDSSLTRPHSLVICAAPGGSMGHGHSEFKVRTEVIAVNLGRNPSAESNDIAVSRCDYPLTCCDFVPCRDRTKGCACRVLNATAPLVHPHVLLMIEFVMLQYLLKGLVFV